MFVLASRNAVVLLVVVTLTATVMIPVCTSLSIGPPLQETESDDDAPDHKRASHVPAVVRPWSVHKAATVSPPAPPKVAAASDSAAPNLKRKEMSSMSSTGTGRGL